MNIEIFLAVYIVLVIIMVICEVLILSNSKNRYLRMSYKPLKSICEDFFNEKTKFDSKEFAYEINRFYDEYIQEMPQLKRLYPNIVVWLDAIIFRIALGNKIATILKPYTYNLKIARDVLEKGNPFNKCEKYQQGILCDIEKIKTTEN